MTKPSVISGPAAFNKCDVVRLLAAFILIAAALLKAYQLATEPVAESSILTFRWSLGLAVLGEFVLGAWLVSGLAKRLSWGITVAAFAMFTVITLSKLIGGEASCVCFGAISLHPGFALAIDVFFLVSLLIARPVLRSAQPTAKPVGRLAMMAIISLAFGIPAAIAMFTYRPATIAEEGTILGSERFVLLEPETWLGGPLPLSRHIDIEKDLKNGRWIIVLYHHDWPDCRQTLPKVMTKAAEDAAKKPGVRIAMIEMAPYARDGESIAIPANVKYTKGKLSGQRDWFVATPTVIELSGGIVMSSKEADGPLRLAAAPRSKKAIPSTPASLTKAKSPETLTRLEHDFGFVEPGAKLTATFKVKNPASRTMAIIDVKSECASCIVAKPPKSIPPRSAADVRVDFTAPKNATGYAKKIVMKTDDPTHSIIVLEVLAQVGMPLSISPKTIDLGTLQAGEKRQVQLTLVNRSDKPFRPIYSISGASGLVAQIPNATIPAKGKLVIPLKVDAGKLSGPSWTANVRIMTDCPTQSSVEATVRFTIAPLAKAPA